MLGDQDAQAVSPVVDGFVVQKVELLEDINQVELVVLVGVVLDDLGELLVKLQNLFSFRVLFLLLLGIHGRCPEIPW